MITENSPPKRYIGIDLHKHYLVAIGVDQDLNQALSLRRVPLNELEVWINKMLDPQDAVVLEMTTNTWEIYDTLLPHVHSVTVVHPPHVKLVTQPRVMNDRIAALNLAKLLAKGLLVSIWVPPQKVRYQRSLIAQRAKMVKLSTQARNRLHAVLHRHRLPLPEKSSPFSSERRTWWVELPLPTEEKACIMCDLETLYFAQRQVSLLEQAMSELAARDERLPLLVQITGIGMISALTILAAIGEVKRFPSAKHLVGYAGLGARVHDSGQTTRTGKITKSGRRDLRGTLVEAAWTAVRCDPHWKAEFERLEPRLGGNKAIVAIARKLLVVVWHVLTKEEAIRFAEPELVARKLMQHTYLLGKATRPKDQSTAAWVRTQLDRLGIGQFITHVTWGTVHAPIPLPPSRLHLPGD